MDVHVCSITSYFHVLSALVVTDEAMRDVNALLNRLKNEFKFCTPRCSLKGRGTRRLGRFAQFNLPPPNRHELKLTPGRP